MYQPLWPHHLTEYLFILGEEIERTWPAKSKYPFLVSCVGPFIENINRTHGLTMLPSYFAEAASISQLFRCITVFNASGGRTIDWQDLSNDEYVVSLSDFRKRLEDWGAKRVIEVIARSRKDHVDMFTNNISLLSFAVQPGISALLASIVVNSWTAFEVLAEDLWVSCLNQRPRLGFIVLGAEPDPSDNEGERQRREQIKADFLASSSCANVDTSQNMGSILRDKWDFSRRTKAEGAYLKAFPNKKTEIEAIFENQQIMWLAALRNTIIHDGGIANKHFSKQFADHRILARIDEGQKVPLDPFMVCNLCLAAITAGKALIDLCGGWLNANLT